MKYESKANKSIYAIRKRKRCCISRIMLLLEICHFSKLDCFLLFEKCILQYYNCTSYHFKYYFPLCLIKNSSQCFTKYLYSFKSVFYVSKRVDWIQSSEWNIISFIICPQCVIFVIDHIPHTKYVNKIHPRILSVEKTIWITISYTQWFYIFTI